MRTRSRGPSGTAPFTFTVTRTGDTTGTNTVDYSVFGSGGDIADTDDFGGAFPSGTVTFTAGVTSQVVTIDVSGDDTVEPDEGFTVMLANPSGVATLGTDSALGNIQNEDVEISVFGLDADKAEGDSGTTAFTFTVTRIGDTTGTNTVDYSVFGSGGDIADTDDFGGAFPSGTVTFTAGVTSQVVTIDVSGDDTVEPDEGFTVLLANPSGVATLGTDSALGNIQNEDVEISVFGLDADKLEGDSGTTPFTFTVTRIGDTTGASTVDFSVSGSGGDAADATDFGGVFPSGIVTFGAGETSQVVTIDVSRDEAAEPDEGFTVTLSSPSGVATLGTDTATGTIQNEDTGVSVFALDADQAEGDTGITTFTFTVARIGDTTDAGAVDFAVSGSGDGPVDATDFPGAVLPSGTLTFASGETTQILTIEVSGDTTPEVNEQFTVTLSNPSANTAVDTDTATGTVVTDDGFVFELSTATAPLGLTAVGLESRVTLGDLDGDGDLDALVGDATGILSYFENTGSASAPAYLQVGGSTPFGLPDTGSFSAPALGDLDGDGDLDLLVGVNSGRFKYYENTGDGSSAAFVRVGGNAPFGLPDTGDLSTPALVDIDADGDLDLFVGNLDGGIRYFKNIGDVEGAVFVQRGGSIPFGLIDVGSRSTPTFLDLDGDGDFDALVGENNGRMNYFENTGSAQKRAFAAPVTDSPFGIDDIGRRSAPVAADLNGDGDLDVLVGEEDGNLNLFDNISPPTVSIAAVDAVQAEGDTATTDFTFTVSRTGDVTSTGTVDYAVVAPGGSMGMTSTAVRYPQGR